MVMTEQIIKKSAKFLTQERLMDTMLAGLQDATTEL